jgi:hypothetical protein
MPNPPTSRTSGLSLVWILSFHLSSLSDPARSLRSRQHTLKVTRKPQSQMRSMMYCSRSSTNLDPREVRSQTTATATAAATAAGVHVSA